MTNEASRKLNTVSNEIKAALDLLFQNDRFASFDEVHAANRSLNDLKNKLDDIGYEFEAAMNLLNRNQAFGSGGRLEYGRGGRMTAQRPVDPGFRYVWIWVSDEEGGMKLLEVRRKLGVFRIDEGYDDAADKYFVKFDSLDDAEMVAEELDKMGIDYNLVDNISSAPTLPYKAYGMGGGIDEAGADYKQQELPLID